MGFKLGKNSINNLAGVDGRLIAIADLAIELTNIDFGLRTEADQAKLFADGVSKADGVNNKSYHQSGKAMDVYAYVDGKASWDKLHLAVIASAMLQASAQLGYKLKWGGLWKSWQDYPHFEIKD
jgi:peptidoglycan L-alanyl-D-glutamate endopeptidase CwlK